MPRKKRDYSKLIENSLEHKENKTPLEHEIVMQKKEAQRRKRKGEPAKVMNLVKDYSDRQGEEPRGNPTGTCKTCGRTFDQDFSEDRNAYSSWRTCPECRKKRARKQEEKIERSGGREIAVAKLPYTPYPWQAEAEKAFETHRFIVLACGNRCLMPGAFINGCDKLIEDVKPGDFVINKEGIHQKAISNEPEEYEGDIYTINGVGIEPIRCNSEHPVLIATGKKKNRDARPVIIKEEYVCAKDIEEYVSRMGKFERPYLKMPRVKGTVQNKYWKFKEYEKNYPNQLAGMTIDEETAWMIGLYCAEGCYLGKAGCKWTLNYEEPELAYKLCSILDSIGIHYNVRERKKDGVRCVIVKKMQFCRKIDEEVGHGSLNKKIPRSILYNKDENILISFMKGYYAGDGYLNKKTVVLSATTVSRTLANQLQTAWTRLGFFSKITSSQREHSRLKRNGEEGTCSREYVVHLNDEQGICLLGYSVRQKKYRKTVIVTQDCIYTKLSSVRKEYGKEKIFVLSTYDESFCSSGTVNRNSGKDRMTIMLGIKYFVECLNENRLIDDPDIVPPVLWWQLAPTEKMAKQNWRELKQFFPKEWIVSCSDSNFTMETIGGGIIEVRSGYNPNDLVGVGLDLCTITEAARFTDLKLAWTNIQARLGSPSRGRKKDRIGITYGQGKAIINSSPLGKNDFYDLFCYGQKDSDYYNSDWWSAKYPWTCNPSNKELAERPVQSKYGIISTEESIRRQIGERAFRSNYLADFLSEDSAVFRNFEENCVINIYNEDATGAKNEKQRKAFIESWQSPIPGQTYVAGYDPATGSSGDSPAMVIRCKDTGRVVMAFDLYGKTYDQQFDFVESICKMYNYAEVHWLRTGHTAIEGQFSKRGLIEVPIDEQGQKKGQLVQTLELAVENKDIHVLHDGSSEIQTLINQMNDYSEKNGKYSNEKMPHDDFVSAMYAAFSDYVVADVPIYYCGLMRGLK